MKSAYKTLAGLEKAAKREGYTFHLYLSNIVDLYKTGYDKLTYSKELGRWVRI